VNAKTLLFIFGTRPEAIKLAPLIKGFQERPDRFDVRVCVTAQHREMLDEVMSFFEIIPAFDLNIMKRNQSLFEITAEGMRGLEKVIKIARPDFIFIQGDTTSAFIGALAGFYERIKIAHVEAGLRSHNRYSPFPEEMNRVLAGHLSDYHFAPTPKARENLLSEGIFNNIHVVGNTAIDALFSGLNIIRNGDLYDGIPKRYSFLDSKRLILVTAHRRESFGAHFENMCMALREIALNNMDVVIIYPVHPNPNVRKPVFEVLQNLPNIRLTEPLAYPDFIWLMNRSYLLLTDSGGIQEEAPSLGKPVLVMREVTERTEGIEAGTARLVGTSKEKIAFETERLLSDANEYAKMLKTANPYGDGNTSKRIMRIIDSVIAELNPS
jgi:UDP-N-acetylglucosamine 2-epimerase (non-hydrolysing)